LIENEERQKQYLALEAEPTEDPDPNKKGWWTLVYKEGGSADERTRRVYIPDKVSAQELRARAETLPEPSLELIFVSDPNLSDAGNSRSRLFTVRTTEKSSDLVAAALGRLLGDLQQTTKLDGYTVSQVTLTFAKDKEPLEDEARAEIRKALMAQGLIGAAKEP